MQESPQQAIERYLRSGEHDAHFRLWPGDILQLLIALVCKTTEVVIRLLLLEQRTRIETKAHLLALPQHECRGLRLDSGHAAS